MTIRKQPLMTTDRCLFSELRTLLTLLVSLVSVTPAFARGCMVGELPAAQEKLSFNSVGAGQFSLLDGYMSPNVYSGPVVDVAFRTQKPLHANGKWYTSSFFKAGLSQMSDRSGYGSMSSLMTDWHFSWARLWVAAPHFRLFAGPELYLKAGGLYNGRNSNNPAHLKLFLTSGLYAESVFNFRIGSFPLSLDWNVSVPLAGYNFAPVYGLQYYEIGYMGRFGEASHFAWPLNVHDIAQCISLDIPAGKRQIRLSYSGDYYACGIGGIRCRMYESSFLIGLVRRIEFKYNGR